MGRHRSIEKLSKQALQLIGRELDHIESEQGRLSHDSSMDLVRYFTALQAQRKSSAKEEDDVRKTLKKMSIQQLKKTAGVDK